MHEDISGEEPGFLYESTLTKVPQRISSGDKERPIQELMLHQVELEMQNDELRKARGKNSFPLQPSESHNAP